MEITGVLTALAVSDTDAATAWYTTLFDHDFDERPMPGLVEWHLPAGTVQLVEDPLRAGGSLMTLQVTDARRCLDELAARGGPAVEPDSVTSDRVLFATLEDPDGNAVTVVEVREGSPPVL